MKFLAEDFLNAYEQLGGISYLEKHPELLERILLKILSNQDEPPKLTINLAVINPWLDFSSRLSYKQPVEQSASNEILEALPIELRASPEQQPQPCPPAIAWKPKPQDGLAQTMRDNPDET